MLLQKLHIGEHWNLQQLKRLAQTDRTLPGIGHLTRQANLFWPPSFPPLGQRPGVVLPMPSSGTASQHTAWYSSPAAFPAVTGRILGMATDCPPAPSPPGGRPAAEPGSMWSPPTNEVFGVVAFGLDMQSGIMGCRDALNFDVLSSPYYSVFNEEPP